MSVKVRIGLISGGFILLAVLWAVFLYRPGTKRIEELQVQQQQAQVELNQLEATLARLRQLQRDEPRLRAEAARLADALPSDPRLPDIILQIQETAGLAGIDFLAITPSLPAAFVGAPGASAGAPVAGSLQAIGITISTTGRYFEIEDFVRRMERLRRATRVNSFNLSPGGATGASTVGGSPTLSVSFQLQMFLVASAPPAAAPAPAPVTPAPAPGASAVPAPAAAGSPGV